MKGAGRTGPPGRRGSGPGRTEGKEPDLAEAEQAERVEVVVAAEQAPVQAGAVAAVGWGGGQDAEEVPGGDRVAARQVGLHREVGGAEVPVGDADQGCPGHRAGEAHPAGTRGVHLLPGLGGQVRAQVPREPALLGRVEGAQHPGGRGEGPAPAGVPRRGGGGRPQERGEQQREQEVGEVHASRVGEGDGGRQGLAGNCGQPRPRGAGRGRGVTRRRSTGPVCARLRIESSVARRADHNTHVHAPPHGGVVPTVHPASAGWRCGRGVRHNRRRRDSLRHRKEDQSWPQS